MTIKTVFEWAELFQEDVSNGASQSDIVQMLEDYKTEQLTLPTLSQQRQLLQAFMSSKRVDGKHSLNEHGVRQEIYLFLKTFNYE